MPRLYCMASRGRAEKWLGVKHRLAGAAAGGSFKICNYIRPNKGPNLNQKRYHWVLFLESYPVFPQQTGCLWLLSLIKAEGSSGIIEIRPFFFFFPNKSWEQVPDCEKWSCKSPLWEHWQGLFNNTLCVFHRMPDLHGHNHSPGWIKQHISLGWSSALPDKHLEKILYRPRPDTSKPLHNSCVPPRVVPRPLAMPEELFSTFYASML